MPERSGVVEDEDAWVHPRVVVRTPARKVRAWCAFSQVTGRSSARGCRVRLARSRRTRSLEDVPDLVRRPLGVAALGGRSVGTRPAPPPAVRRCEGAPHLVGLGPGCSRSSSHDHEDLLVEDTTP